MKKIVPIILSLFLAACGGDEIKNSPSGESALAGNTRWPYEVVGEVDIIDAGFGDSDYANWAIGSVTVNGEEISIEFETLVLRSAGIGSEFNFSSPAKLMLGSPKQEYGMLTYPVVEIK